MIGRILNVLAVLLIWGMVVVGIIAVATVVWMTLSPLSSLNLGGGG